jgi:hypothetical protein
MIQPGTIFRLLVGGSHFHVVISNEMNSKVLCVNFTDSSNDPDSPCKLTPGEHECITKESVIPYRRAKEWPAKVVKDELEKGTAIQWVGQCSDDLLAKIIEGARKADDLTARFLEYLK